MENCRKAHSQMTNQQSLRAQSQTLSQILCHPQEIFQPPNIPGFQKFLLDRFRRKANLRFVAAHPRRPLPPPSCLLSVRLGPSFK